MVKDLGFCTVQLDDNYLTCIVKEGTILSIDKSQKLVQDLLSHFNGRPFVYITHRINSYAVDPAIYNVAVQIENLVGFAVVSTNNLALKNAEIEKLFFKKPFKIFKDLENAKQWANTIVKNSTQLK